MVLNRDQVRECVIESVRELLEKTHMGKIDEQTDPIIGLGLDSEDGVDLACALSQKLNYDIPDKVNPLVDDEKRRPRRIGEIVDLMCKLLTTYKEENHG
jgi:acyl carrier protein